MRAASSGDRASIFSLGSGFLFRSVSSLSLGFTAETRQADCVSAIITRTSISDLGCKRHSITGTDYARHRFRLLCNFHRAHSHRDAARSLLSPDDQLRSVTIYRRFFPSSMLFFFFFLFLSSFFRTFRRLVRSFYSSVERQLAECSRVTPSQDYILLRVSANARLIVSADYYYYYY